MINVHDPSSRKNNRPAAQIILTWPVLCELRLVSSKNGVGFYLHCFFREHIRQHEWIRQQQAIPWRDLFIVATAITPHLITSVNNFYITLLYARTQGQTHFWVEIDPSRSMCHQNHASLSLLVTLLYWPLVFWTLTKGSFNMAFCCTFALMRWNLLRWLDWTGPNDT